MLQPVLDAIVAKRQGKGYTAVRISLGSYGDLAIEAWLGLHCVIAQTLLDLPKAVAEDLRACPSRKEELTAELQKIKAELDAIENKNNL